jgi:transaldolase/glucose-6-phosphate isomerase
MTSPEKNPLQKLLEFGQSPWYDNIRRSLISSGELARMVREDGLSGVTSNPAIFEKAIGGTDDYDTALADLERKGERDVKTIYETLAIKDIQDATDVLRVVFDRSGGRDGYVSIEVSPYLAADTAGTLEEARRLWQAVGRPNVMVKVPATPQGISAIEVLISEGININVTLLFSNEAYEAVASAYIAGIEKLVAKGGDPSKVGSVASFFVSRIDSAIDPVIEGKLKSASPAERGLLEKVLGKVAIANARLAYLIYKKLFTNARWKALEAKGARVQRLLWASTSTKNAAFRDVIYVEELIGPDTVNTIPAATWDAFRDHGRLRPSLEEDLDAATETMAALEQAGVSMKAVAAKLVDDGVKLFADAFDKLLGAVERKRQAGLGAKLDRMSHSLPAELQAAVNATLEDWRAGGKVRRLWAKDASLWTGEDESRWLGWLGIAAEQSASAARFRSLAQEVKKDGFTHILLCGMGGSSLCPEVMKLTFGRIEGYPELHVLDSTDPAQIRTTEKKLDLARTLFIVSSKSGSTLEPNIYKDYFFERVKTAVGAERAGSRFIAITDPGSKMEEVARRDKFRHIFFGLPSIGGRYSALSDFGMIPAAAMGIDVERFLDLAAEMVACCGPFVPPSDNPGVTLGAILGTLGKMGRDKVTLVSSPGIFDLGAWLEQLLAESTGKLGLGLVPVDLESAAPPEAYGQDRIFVYLRLESAPDAGQDAALAALERAGQPVVRIAIPASMNLGQEFFRWEFATAVAGAILGINAFNQPDVEASKIATKALTSEYEKTGSLAHEAPILEDQGIKLFTDARNAAAIAQAAGADRSLAGYLRAHLARLGNGDYFGVLAYLEMNQANLRAAQEIRHAVRDRRRVATVLGFGPRFLHSTGQAYKGGPNSGVFLQITCDEAADLPVPGAKYTFGVVKAAQARGDFQVLAERGRRALRVHLGKDTTAGLKALATALSQALK